MPPGRGALPKKATRLHLHSKRWERLVFPGARRQGELEILVSSSDVHNASLLLYLAYGIGGQLLD